MFDEIKVNMLRSKYKAAYKAAIRAQKEFFDAISECPHHHIESTNQYHTDSGAVEYHCCCCGKQLYRREDGSFTTTESFIDPEVLTLNGKEIVKQFKVYYGTN